MCHILIFEVFFLLCLLFEKVFDIIIIIIYRMCLTFQCYYHIIIIIASKQMYHHTSDDFNNINFNNIMWVFRYCGKINLWILSLPYYMQGMCIWDAEFCITLSIKWILLLDIGFLHLEEHKISKTWWRAP